MVDQFSFLEDEDYNVKDDQESQSSELTPRREALRRVFGNNYDTTSSSSDEEGQGGQCPVEDEQVSPPRPTGLQVPKDIP